MATEDYEVWLRLLADVQSLIRVGGIKAGWKLRSVTPALGSSR